MTTPPALAVIGENIIDLVPSADLAPSILPSDEDADADASRYSAIAGGSPANAAIAATRLGTPTALLARIGADVFGRRIRQRLTDAGVDTRFLVDAAEPSSLAVVSFDQRRRASYDFWVNGTADWQWRPGELPATLPAEFGALHFGSIAALNPPGAAAIAGFAAAERTRGQVLISLDPNLRTSIVGSGPRVVSEVEKLVRLAHLVKVSDDDLAELYPDTDPLAVAQSWRLLGPDLIVLTRGERGAIAYPGPHLAEYVGLDPIEVAAPAVELVDTVGAGDAFNGALLHGILTHGTVLAHYSRDELTDVVRTAAVAAALACTRAGANPPTAEELTTYLKTNN